MKALRTLAILVAGFLVVGCFKVEVNLAGDADDKKATSKDESGGWRDMATDVAGQIFLGAEKGVIFYAYDTLAYPNEPVDLAVKLQSAKTFKDIAEVMIGFYKGAERIGAAKTDKDGRATLQWTPPEAGDYLIVAKVIAVPDEDLEELLQLTPAPLLVAARPKETEFVVVDLDHTVVGSSFFRVLVGGAKPMSDSVEVTHRIAEKYSIIYLTHRPDLLTRKSKSWLKDNGYPDGPLLVSTLKDAFGDSGKFKTAKLAAVKETFPNIKVGIGDKLSDAQAYVDNGLVAFLIPHYKEKPEDMREMSDEIRKLRGDGRLQVVENWKQIEAGIFEGQKFPPEDFVRYLKRRADQLEEEKDKKDEKDDDDD